MSARVATVITATKINEVETKFLARNSREGFFFSGIPWRRGDFGVCWRGEKPFFSILFRFSENRERSIVRVWDGGSRAFGNDIRGDFRAEVVRLFG